MRVLTGEKIIELDTHRTLTVDVGFDSEKDTPPSKYFDFLATYINRAGVTVEGQDVHSNRGFSLEGEGIVWSRLED